MCVPVRPKPDCTSSAMYRPPAARVISATGARNPAGSGKMPSEENSESARKAASRTPYRSRSAMAQATAAVKFTPAAGAGTTRTSRPSGMFGPRLGESSASEAVTPW